jgi:Uma2 family endonuclease
MATATKPLTAAEFAALPDEPDSVMELVRGEIVRMPKPKPRHGRIANRIAFC